MIFLILLCVIKHAFTIIPDNNLVHNSEYRKSLDNEKFLRTYIREIDDTYYIDQNNPNSYNHKDLRRIFGWLRNIIDGNKTETIEKSKVDYELSKQEFQRIERNLTEALTKLELILRQLLDVIKYSKQESFKTIDEFIPVNRKKRDTNTTMDAEQNLNHTNINATANVNGTNELLTVNSTQDGRRSFSDMHTLASDEVKERLLRYIQEGFNDIKIKIESLRTTKDLLSNDINFRIGYIIANIDVLEANMVSLKDDISKKSTSLTDWDVLNLYDTVKASNSAISNLLDVLKLNISKLH